MGFRGRGASGDDGGGGGGGFGSVVDCGWLVKGVPPQGAELREEAGGVSVRHLGARVDGHRCDHQGVRPVEERLGGFLGVAPACLVVPVESGV